MNCIFCNKELKSSADDYRNCICRECRKQKPQLTIELLTQENQQLKQQLEEIKQNCNYQVMLMCSKENALLKQQLHDLPKKIVEEIENELLPEFSGSEDYEHKYYIITKRILDTILKKYGGENE